MVSSKYQLRHQWETIIDHRNSSVLKPALPVSFAIRFIEHMRVMRHLCAQNMIREKNKNIISLRFYRAKHYGAKRGISIACRQSVRPSVRL